MRAGKLASMRPRRLAAENATGHYQLASMRWRASMRPRRLAAENRHVVFTRNGAHVASMRPRRLAAENLEMALSLSACRSLQ